VEIAVLDETLAGVVMASGTGQITIAKNQIPHPSEVDVMIASKNPRPLEKEKMELGEALKLQIITPTEYRIMARKKGLDIPVGNEAEWQNYRRAVMENIILFGDGVEPGSIIVSHNDIHSVHLMVLNSLIGSPEFYLATPAVRTKITEHKAEHESMMGILPTEMDYPEDAAEQSQQMMPDMGQLEQLMQ
jgi:hypothetical protein